MTHDLNTLILALESLLYALVAVNATQRRSLWERATRWLVLYAAACCLWTLGQAAQARGWPTFASDEILARIGPFGMLLLAWLFLHLTRAFLRLGGVGGAVVERRAFRPSPERHSQRIPPSWHRS